jgi:hypothetical protein
VPGPGREFWRKWFSEKHSLRVRPGPSLEDRGWCRPGRGAGETRPRVLLSSGPDPDNPAAGEWQKMCDVAKPGSIIIAKQTSSQP